MGRLLFFSGGVFCYIFDVFIKFSCDTPHTAMDEFEELSGSEAAGAAPAPALVDPASEFLEREKEELGDVLGETQESGDALTAPMDGLGLSESQPDRVSPSLSGMTMPSSMMSGMPRIEPETIRQWREDNEKRLAEKDAKEEEQLEQLKEQAKKELSDWYKHYKDQVEKTKSVNRSAELEFVAEVNDIKPGTEWERVNKLVDFNAKHAKSTKDTTRMKSIMLQLKQNGKAAA